MDDVLFWCYLVNATLLINHEIDSAYWQEWKLFSLKFLNGINSFLILHFPLLLIVLYGLIMIDRCETAGYIISFLLCAGGLFAFFFHNFHLRKGRQEFNNKLSKAILVLTLIISTGQIIITTLIILSAS